MNRERLASGSQAWGVIASKLLLYRPEQQVVIAFLAPVRRRQTPRGIPLELLNRADQRRERSWLR